MRIFGGAGCCSCGEPNADDAKDLLEVDPALDQCCKEEGECCKPEKKPQKGS